jgi:hypothetical protein
MASVRVPLEVILISSISRSLGMMGMKLDGMMDCPDMKLAGIARFLQAAGSGNPTLFI